MTQLNSTQLNSTQLSSAQLNSTQPNPAQPNRTLPNLTEPYRTLPNLTEPYRTLPNLTEPYRTLPNLTEPYRTLPNRTEPNRTRLNSTRLNSGQTRQVTDDSETLNNRQDVNFKRRGHVCQVTDRMTTEKTRNQSAEHAQYAETPPRLYTGSLGVGRHPSQAQGLHMGLARHGSRHHETDELRKMSICLDIF